MCSSMDIKLINLMMNILVKFYATFSLFSSLHLWASYVMSRFFPVVGIGCANSSLMVVFFLDFLAFLYLSLQLEMRMNLVSRLVYICLSSQSRFEYQ